MEIGPVRFVTSKDGFRIAYSVTGVGRPLVVIPPGLTDLRSVWKFFPIWMEALAQRFQVIVLDMRGRGMSSHGLTEAFSHLDYLLDVEAVIDDLKLSGITFFTIGGFGHVAVRYAAAHPENVASLVFSNCPTGVVSYARPLFEALPAENWELFIALQTPSGLDEVDVREWRDGLLRPGAYEDWLISSTENSRSNVAAELPLLRVPCLVFHSRGLRIFNEEESIKFAAQIPDARVVLLEGGPLTIGSGAEGVPALQDFLIDAGILPDGSREAGLDTPLSSEIPDEMTEKHVILSPRQVEVLRLLAEGRTTREISDRLFLSERTVERHIADVYNKIGARNRAEATAYALRHHG